MCDAMVVSHLFVLVYSSFQEVKVPICPPDQHLYKMYVVTVDSDDVHYVGYFIN